MVVAPFGGFRHLLAHFEAVPTMERVALDVHGIDLLATEDLLERFFDRRGAGPRGAGDHDDRMLDRHCGQ